MEKKSFDNNTKINNNTNINNNNDKDKNTAEIYDRNKTLTDYRKENTKILKDNNYYFDKNHKMTIRYPKNYFRRTPEKQSRTKVSVAAPEWMKVVTDEKNKMYNDILCKKEETLSIFSRYNKWITVTPRSKNRRRPLEKMKIEKMDETSKIMPNWMQIRVKKDMDLYGMFKSAEYNSIRHVGYRDYIIFEIF